MKQKAVIASAALGMAAGFMGVRALRGHKKTLPYGEGIKIKRTIAVNRPAAELYRHWRNLEMLPGLIAPLKRVDTIDSSHSHWEVSGPGRMRFKWNAEIIADRDNEMIGWRSLAGSDVDLAGSVRFEPQPVGNGTIVTVALQYNPPAGRLGAALARFFGERPEEMIDEALCRFKQRMEGADVGPREVPKAPTDTTPTEDVDKTSKDSFPASDPPAWTGTGV
jgi:uncharacterized membrane protein